MSDGDRQATTLIPPDDPVQLDRRATLAAGQRQLVMVSLGSGCGFFAVLLLSACVEIGLLLWAVHLFGGGTP
jgi:methylase of polypeptide subunit release factors